MKGVLTGNRFLSHHTIFGQMNFWTLPGNTKPVAPLGDQGRICLWWRGTHDSLVMSDAIWSRCSAQQAGRQPRDLLVGHSAPPSRGDLDLVTVQRAAVGSPASGPPGRPFPGGSPASGPLWRPFWFSVGSHLLSVLCNHIVAPLKVAAVDDDLDEVQAH